MRSTIDVAGRLVIPKSIRDAAGLIPGQPLEVIMRDGRIEIQPVSATLELVDEGGVAVAAAGNEMPPLTVDEVRDVLERVRR